MGKPDLILIDEAKGKLDRSKSWQARAPIIGLVKIPDRLTIIKADSNRKTASLQKSSLYKPLILL
jgi:excinuclease UvrABC nuclease subunit